VSWNRIPSALAALDLAKEMGARKLTAEQHSRNQAPAMAGGDRRNRQDRDLPTKQQAEKVHDC